MPTASLLSLPQSVPSGAQPQGALALALQEPFTVAIRLRSNRQVASDAVSFRAHIKHLLSAADAEARRVGYDPGYVRLAIYAFVAFLDESVLSSQQPIFSEWPRQPLQEEVFGDNIGGELFFRHLEELLGHQDSAQLADLLEVFQLCLLLGFRGRFGGADHAGLQAMIGAVAAKIHRIRGPRGDLSPAWKLPAGEVLAPTRDPWVPRLLALAAVALVLALGIFLLARLSLHSGVSDVRELVAQLTR